MIPTESSDPIVLAFNTTEGPIDYCILEWTATL